MYQKWIPLLVVVLAAVCLTAVTAQSSPTNQWEAEIRKFEETDRVQPPPRGAVLFVGSSSVRLWQTLAEDFPGVKVINHEQFAWLRPVSELSVRIDELLDAVEPVTAEDAALCSPGPAPCPKPS
jgi:hypothetical protein